MSPVVGTFGRLTDGLSDDAPEGWLVLLMLSLERVERARAHAKRSHGIERRMAWGSVRLGLEHARDEVTRYRADLAAQVSP